MVGGTSRTCHRHADRYGLVWRGSLHRPQARLPGGRGLFTQCGAREMHMQCARPHELNPNQSWGAHPPRVLLDAPRIQPFRAPQLPEFPELSMFSARARKTALEARALPIYGRLSSLPEIEAD